MKQGQRGTPADGDLPAPYLRVARDGRGYENTYVLQNDRQAGRTRTRLLYWFRTPLNVKVGRERLDDEVIRAIEAQNPDTTFDWPRMLKQDLARPPAARAAASARRAASRRRPAAASASVEASTAARQEDQPPPPPVPAESVVPPEPEEAETAATPAPDDDRAPGTDTSPVHPVTVLLGQDALERLRSQYADIRARIHDHLSELDAEEMLMTRAASIDPDSWESVDDAVYGIERFDVEIAEIEADLERLAPAE